MREPDTIVMDEWDCQRPKWNSVKVLEAVFGDLAHFVDGQVWRYCYKVTSTGTKLEQRKLAVCYICEWAVKNPRELRKGQHHLESCIKNAIFEGVRRDDGLAKEKGPDAHQSVSSWTLAGPGECPRCKGTGQEYVMFGPDGSYLPCEVCDATGKLAKRTWIQLGQYENRTGTWQGPKDNPDGSPDIRSYVSEVENRPSPLGNPEGDFFRKPVRSDGVSEAVGEDYITDQSLPREEWLRGLTKFLLASLIRKSGPKLAMALELVEVDGHTWAEAAELIGQPEESLRRNARKFQAAMRESFWADDLYDEPAPEPRRRDSDAGCGRPGGGSDADNGIVSGRLARDPAYRLDQARTHRDIPGMADKRSGKPVGQRPVIGGRYSATCTVRHLNVSAGQRKIGANVTKYIRERETSDPKGSHLTEAA